MKKVARELDSIARIGSLIYSFSDVEISLPIASPRVGDLPPKIGGFFVLG